MTVAPVRPAEPSDLAAIQRLVDRAFEGYIPAIGRKPGPMLADHASLIDAGLVDLLAPDGHLAGLIVLQPEADHLVIEILAVDPAVQGRGHGRVLLGFAEAEARRIGRAELRLVTNQAMLGNITLYGHMGFEETGRGLQDGYSRVFMRKRLA